MNLHDMNKKHEETNYCAFDDNWKLKATKDCIQFYFYLRRLKTFQFSVRKMMTAKRRIFLLTAVIRKLSVVLSLKKFGVSQNFIDIVCCFISLIVEQKLFFAYLEIQVGARNIMMVDTQTDYLIDQWTNCKTATRNLSGDWLRCYDLLFIPRENFKS